jgi:hypothetical protein
MFNFQCWDLPVFVETILMFWHNLQMQLSGQMWQKGNHWVGRGCSPVGGDHVAENEDTAELPDLAFDYFVGLLH